MLPENRKYFEPNFAIKALSVWQNAVVKLCEIANLTDEPSDFQLRCFMQDIEQPIRDLLRLNNFPEIYQDFESNNPTELKFTQSETTFRIDATTKAINNPQDSKRIIIDTKSLVIDRQSGLIQITRLLNTKQDDFAVSIQRNIDSRLTIDPYNGIVDIKTLTSEGRFRLNATSLDI
jgi:hypothetical protein